MDAGEIARWNTDDPLKQAASPAYRDPYAGEAACLGECFYKFLLL